MPQLMPLGWNFSVFMVLLILLIMSMLYSYKMEAFINLNFNEKGMKVNLNWWW